MLLRMREHEHRGSRSCEAALSCARNVLYQIKDDLSAQSSQSTAIEMSMYSVDGGFKYAITSMQLNNMSINSKGSPDDKCSKPT